MQKKIRNKISLLNNAELPLNITSAEGLIREESFEKLVKNEKVSRTDIRFAGIGKFSTYPRFITNTGRLKYKEEDWKKIINQL